MSFYKKKRVKGDSFFRLSEERVLGYILLIPLAIILLGLLGYPLIRALLLSFQDKMIGYPDVHFIGFKNYTALLKDEIYYQALINTLIFTFGAVIVKLLMGLFTALALNQPIPARNIIRGVVLIPWAVPTVVTLVIWGWMYNDLYGILNFILLRLGILKQPHNWLSNPSTAMASVVVVNIWRGFPFFALVILAGLQTIPEELYEAARIDGAGFWAQFWHVTLPGITTMIMIVTLLSTIWTIGDFTIVWVLTQGGPGYATHLLSTYTFATAFLGRELSKGVAISTTLLPLLLLFIILLVRAVERREEEVL